MDTATPVPLPLWKRIADFPLAALAIALGLTIAIVLVTSLPGPQMTRLLGPGLAQPIGVAVLIALLVVMQKTVMRRLGERKHDDLPLAGAARGLATGTIAAFVLFGLIVAVAALLGAYRIAGWGGMTSWVFLLFAAGVGAGFVEEFIFRGILFRWIEEFAGSWAALGLTSALFGLVHIANPGASLFSSFAIAVEAGLMLGGAYMLTRSLWLPIGIHFGWNVTQGLVWDVPVSGNEVDGLVDAQRVGDPLVTGGSFGLEASVIALVIAGAFGVWLVWRAAQAGEVMAPRWVRRRAAAQSA
ncbi:CPBP family intramembrane glutamic endopeptidase [Erythrobacter sp. NE805]|uniref:CPBP family intramembrane glutamic endopeptidase n=1 Tax=Erythrobacter sp. NE805 TaxID=3389875 RepID=UPI00396B1BB8